MAGASYSINGFLGGEISQFAQGRWDRPDYRVSLNVCLNAFPVEIGPWVRRPGTAFAGTTRGGNSGRVLGWSFEQVSPVTLEFTDGFLRFRSGLTWLNTNDSVGVSSISSANPAVLTLASAVGWASGNAAILGNLGTSIPLLQNRQLLLTKLTTTTFSIADALTGENINGATLGVSGLAAGATVSRIQEVTTPYIAGSWSSASLRMVQAETTGILLNGSYAPQALTVTGMPGTTVSAQFALGPATFDDGPYLDPFTNGVQASPNQTTGVIQLTLSFPAYVSTTSYGIGQIVTYSSVNYQSLTDQNVGNTPGSSPSDWVAVSASAAINAPIWNPTGTGQGFLQSDIGRLVRLFSEPALWAAGSTYAEGTVVAYNPTGVPGASTYWQSLVGSNTGNVPGASLTYWELVAPGAALPSIGSFTSPVAAAGPAQWTWGKITGLLSFISGSVSGVVHIGNMTFGGGIAAAFNGTLDQNAAASAGYNEGSETIEYGQSSFTMTSYVGQNFSGTVATAYAISSATLLPSTDEEIIALDITSMNVGDPLEPPTGFLVIESTAYLYASNSAPSGPTDGTLLGQATIANDYLYNEGFNSFPSVPVNIASNNTTSTFAYIWVTIQTVVTNTPNSPAVHQVEFTLAHYVAQMEIVSSTTGVSSNGVSVELLGPALLYTTTIRTWELGAYSNTTGWPTCGLYYDGRLWLGGAIPNRFDACCSNGISGGEINFAPTDQYGNVTDANSISLTLNADSVNPIEWMMPTQQGIILGTQQREWLLYAPSSGGMTPTNIASHPVTRIGSANILPAATEHTFVFVQRFALKLMEYFADIFSGKFTAPNLADKAQHITREGIEEIAYVQATAPVLWGRCGDGSLFGMSYKRDTLMTSSGPTYYAWHRHTLGSGREIESITSGPNVGGDLDAISIVTNQTNTGDPQAGVYHVEVLTDTLDEVATLAEYWLLDDAVIPSSTISSNTAVSYSAWASGTTYSAGQIVTYSSSTYISLVGSNTGNIPSSSPASWLLTNPAPYGGLTLNGLWHLNGEQVAVTAGGLDCGNYVPVNGSVFVPYGDGVSAGTAGGQFTAIFAATNPQIVVGFPYNSDGQLVRPMTPQDSGARNGPALGKKRRAHQAAALLNTAGASSAGGNQLAIAFGTSFAKLQPAIVSYGSTGNTGSIAPGQSFSGVWFDTIGDESSFDGMLCWRVSRPLPANIVAVEPFLETQDK